MYSARPSSSCYTGRSPFVILSILLPIDTTSCGVARVVVATARHVELPLTVKIHLISKPLLFYSLSYVPFTRGVIYSLIPYSRCRTHGRPGRTKIITWPNSGNENSRRVDSEGDRAMYHSCYDPWENTPNLGRQLR